MRFTKRVSMWPVGLIGIPGISSPVVNPRTNKVIDFYDGWLGGRTFPVDMAAFAVSVAFFLEVNQSIAFFFFNSLKFENLKQQHPGARMPFKAGYEEDEFLKGLNLRLEDIEPKANSCSQVQKKSNHQTD